LSDSLLGLAPRRDRVLRLLDANPLTNPVPAAAQVQAPIWSQAAQQPIDMAKAWQDWRMRHAAQRTAQRDDYERRVKEVIAGLTGIDAVRAQWRVPDPLAVDAAMGFMPMGFAGALGKSAPKVMRVALDNPRIPFTTVLRNPTAEQLNGLLAKSKYRLLRRFEDPATGDHFFWDAGDEVHDAMAGNLGIENPRYEGSGSWPDDIK
jgi:hypothetical protein